MFKKGIFWGLAMFVLLSWGVLPLGAQEKGKGEPQEKKAEGTQTKKPEGGEERQGIPTGQVTINVTNVAAGLGVTWGDGTLNFQGKDYKFKVSGLSLIALGVTSLSAKGDVYNLKKLDDFPGKYFGVEAGGTLVKGSSGMLLKNGKGVVLNLKAEQKGAELKVGDQGLSISPAWD